MVVHIVTWNLVNCNKEIISNEIKEFMLSHKDDFKGLIELKYITNPINGSTKDVMLYTIFKDVESLNQFKDNYYHKESQSKYDKYLINREVINYLD